jgi:hypothetical protein
MHFDHAHTDHLAALIAGKNQVLEVLVRLSRRQLDLIAAGEMTALVKLLAAKQTVMNQLQSLEQKLAPFRDEDPDRRAWRSPAERAACQDCAQQAQMLLAEVIKLEKQAEQAMVARRDAVAAALVAAQSASDARAAYATPSTQLISNVHVEG